jgi:hypothetical protein
MNIALTSPAPRPRPTVPAGRPLDDSWRQWVAENRLRGCTPESMLMTMTGAGLDPQASVAALNELERNPVYLAALRHQQLLRKLESVVGNLQTLWQSSPAYAVVEKRAQLSRDEFVDRYVHGCRPVVIQGLARDWPALQRWSPQDLKQRFGHLEVEVQAERQADPQYEVNKLQHRRRVRLGDFVDHVLASGPSNDHYLTANNELLRRPEFAPLLADIGSLPDYCDARQLANSCSFWFGPAGTVTPLHHDTLMLFHTQMVGRSSAVLLVEELLVFGRALQRGGRGLALDGGGHRVEVAGADLALVLHRGEAALGGGEFLLLQLDEGAHVVARVAVGQVEHAVVQAVEAGQRDELELVAHRAQLALELGDGGVVEVLLPVEGRAAVVGQQLARELGVDRVGEVLGELEVGRAGLAPDQVGVLRRRPGRG